MALVVMAGFAAAALDVVSIHVIAPGEATHEERVQVHFE
jgi:hypothetical protein